MIKTVRGNCFLVILLLCNIRCNKEDDMYVVGNDDGISLSEIISFKSVTPVELEADSASVCSINVQINPEAGSGNRIVKFFTDGGVFANGDTLQLVTANSEGRASASLISTVPKKTNVRVMVLDSFFIDTVITFIPALPDDFLLSADNYQGDTSTNFQITNTLFRNPQRGKVCDPVKVLFSVTPLDTTVNLVYSQFAFTEDQVATITLLNPYKATGRFNVTSKTAAAVGDSLSRTVLIEIK